jgi:hypothetical protein
VIYEVKRQTFNSLSRDHTLSSPISFSHHQKSFQLPLSGSPGRTAIMLAVTGFQLPLSGSRNRGEFPREWQGQFGFQLPLSGSPTLTSSSISHLSSESFNSLSRDHPLSATVYIAPRMD